MNKDKKINFKDIVNKRVEDLTEDEAGLLERLQFRSKIKFFMYFIPAVAAIFSVLSFLNSVGTGVFVLISESLIVASCELRYIDSFKKHYSLKSLGLNKEEWKELKREGVVKKAKKLAKEYYTNKALSDFEARQIVYNNSIAYDDPFDFDNNTVSSKVETDSNTNQKRIIENMIINNNQDVDTDENKI